MFFWKSQRATLAQSQTGLSAAAFATGSKASSLSCLGVLRHRRAGCLAVKMGVDVGNLEAKAR
jgi:hypothetical protein